MAVYYIPKDRNMGSYFGEGMSSGLQAAFQMQLQKKMEEENRKRAFEQNLQNAQKLAPQLFQSNIPSMGTRGIYPPYRPGQLNMDNLGNAQVNLSTGEIAMKPEDAFQSYYRSLLPQPGTTPTVGTPGNDLVYRDVTGNEISPEQAQRDIESGNTAFTISKRDITKTGIKESVISKPEDLEKVKANKEKSAFVISRAQDALNTIRNVKAGLSNFGTFHQYIPKELSPGTPYYTWKANLEKLLSGKMIDLMIEMKEASKTGATGFGQLSEHEGQILREASTALSGGLPPEEALKLLNTMENAAAKIIQGSNTQRNGVQEQDDPLGLR